MPSLQKSDIKYCQKIMAQAGPTYYWATKLLPKHIREATYVLYAFYRVPDDIVDLHKGDPTNDLNSWVQEWENTIATSESHNPVLRSALAVHQIYNIPFKYSHSFLKSMLQDLTQKSYSTYKDLEEYMFGSASVVGIMMTHLFVKNPSEKVLKKAQSLGEAMQLTNFLRDIKEDLEDRSRIYLPQDELKNYKIPTNLKALKYNKDWENFMDFQIERNVSLYKEGFDGLQYLPFQIRFCVQLASIMYMTFLFQIIDSDYKVMNSTYKLSKLDKFKALFKTIFQKFNFPSCKKL